MASAPQQQSKQHSPRQQQQKNRNQLDPLSPDNFIKSSQEFLADAYTGRDVTRPRDLYAFLSLGHIPEPRRVLLQSRSVNTDCKRVTFDFRNSVSRRKSCGADETPARYLQVDLRKSPLIPLPSIKNANFPSESKDNGTFEQIVAEELAREIQNANFPSESKNNGAFEQIVAEELAREIQKEIPISLVKGYHKVNISTTYIFAPEERLPETVKYSTKVVLPKIPLKAPGTADIPPPSVLTIDSQNNVEALHKKKFEVVNFSPRRKTIPQGTHVFGMRPECMFLNTQLGDKNPLLRDPNKASMASNVPKALPGLQDLKDYECYPDVYWKVRAETITQPRDLEADMIDRDLYRLRQISTLKLNSIERTFQVRQDPFRRWRGKAGEPLFSPKQQKPPQRKWLEKTKATETSEDSNNNLNKSKVMLEVTVTPLRLTNSDMRADDKGQDPLLSSRSNAGNSNVAPHVKGTSVGRIDTADVDCPDMPTFDTPNDASVEITPREAVEVSLNTYRKLQEERDTEENLNFGKVTVQKLHQMKNNKDTRKKAMKTAKISVDLESVDVYNRQHRGASWRQLSDRTHSSVQNNKSVLNLSRRDNDTGRVTDGVIPPDEAHGLTNRSDPQSLGDASRQKTVAPVASLLFKPPPDYKVPGSYPDGLGSSIYGNASSYHALEELGESFLLTGTDFVHPSPEAPRSEVGNSAKAGHKNSSPPMKAVKIEVFSERKPDRHGPIKIPTGRTTYHPDMPAYRLDLRNYPPMNARQMCIRSNSAGYPDSRQTQLTAATLDSLQRELASGHAHAQSAVANGIGAELTSQPPRTAEVDIRFSGKGEVIVTSRDIKRAASGRRSR